MPFQSSAFIGSKSKAMLSLKSVSQSVVGREGEGEGEGGLLENKTRLPFQNTLQFLCCLSYSMQMMLRTNPRRAVAMADSSPLEKSMREVQADHASFSTNLAVSRQNFRTSITASALNAAAFSGLGYRDRCAIAGQVRSHRLHNLT